MFRIRTARLDLVAATLETANAWDRETLARLLQVELPLQWPPPFNDEASAPWVRDRLAEDWMATGWLMWYFVLDDGDSRIVIGNGGFKGRPAKGVVEIGYSLVPEFQQNGYATEAVTALLDWAFAHDDVCSVIAETLPELAASQGLLRKLGFRPIDGKGSPGVIRFELSKHCGGDGRQSSDTRPFLPALTAKF